PVLPSIVFLLFNVCLLALAALVLPRPRAHVYTFLAAFLVLGFWLKVLLHKLGLATFVEPVGDFSGSAEQWDRTLLAASCGALGLIAARVVHLWLGRSIREEAAPPAPRWFIARRRPVWILTLLAVVAVNVANLEFAFFQVGVKPRLLLPFAGHVLLGWLVNIGGALWIAALVGWEYRERGIGRSLLAPIAEAGVSAVSAFSRLNFLVHALPYA